MFAKLRGMPVVLGAALALAGCQSTVTPLNLASGSSIEAAGFKSVDQSKLPNVPNFQTALAAYQCPAEKCGAQSILVIASLNPPNSNSGSTLESAIRSNIFNSAALKPFFEKSLFSTISTRHPGTSGHLSSFRLDAKSATLSMTGNVAQADGSTVYLSVFGRFIGNETRVIVSLSSSVATAARYARPSWLN